MLEGGEVEESKSESSDTDNECSIPLPLDHAVGILRLVAQSYEREKQPEKTETTPQGESSLVTLKWKDYEKLQSLAPEQIDIPAYCSDVVEETKRDQAKSALEVIRSALAMIIDVPDSSTVCFDSVESDVEPSATEISEDSEHESLVDTTTLSQMAARTQESQTEELKTICLGLMYATAIEHLKEETSTLLRGFTTHVLFLISSLRQHIVRIDAFGSQIP